MSTKQDHNRSADDKVEQTLALLQGEVANLVSGDDWQNYLVFQSKFHNYSAGNVLLIRLFHAQAYLDSLVPEPEPSYVAGYRAWQALGRQVDKGQRSYPVLAPVKYSVREATSQEGRRRLAPNEEPGSNETLESRQVLRGFRIGHVFDISQTSGAQLPTQPLPQLLSGQAPPGLRETIETLITQAGFEIEWVEGAKDIDGANGQTDYLAKTVSVRKDLDDCAQVKTLIHEAGHVYLHADSASFAMSRPQKEVEAESVAFVVAHAHGMDSGQYSFPYIASWAGGQDGPKAVALTQARIAKISKQFILASSAAHTPGGTPLSLGIEVESGPDNKAQTNKPAAKQRAKKVITTSFEPEPIYNADQLSL
jgi:hypothetical protein